MRLWLTPCWRVTSSVWRHTWHMLPVPRWASLKSWIFTPVMRSDAAGSRVGIREASVAECSGRRRYLHLRRLRYPPPAYRADHGSGAGWAISPTAEPPGARGERGWAAGGAHAPGGS